jgi:hypothetical protein
MMLKRDYIRTARKFLFFNCESGQNFLVKIIHFAAALFLIISNHFFSLELFYIDSVLSIDYSQLKEALG